jgi:competence protein ComEC
LVLGFALLAGAGASIVRAALMLSVALLCEWKWHKQLTFAYLVCSGLLRLAYDPNYLWDLGLQLSFAATFGIICLAPFLVQLVRLYRPDTPQWLADWLVLPVTASVATMPVAYFYFGNLPPYTILANLLATPAVALASWGSAVATPGFFVWSPLGAMLELCLWPILWLVVRIASIFVVF